MTVFRFSANTGFLWKELPFLDRIRQAAKYGFDAVEFHDEAQSEDRNALKETLAATGLPVIGLNVRMGDTAGCAALPGMACQAKRDIAAAIGVAEDIGATAVHVLSGKTETLEASAAFLDSLRFALDNTKLKILIEPICREQVPGYFLNTIEQAVGILAEIGNSRATQRFERRCGRFDPGVNCRIRYETHPALGLGTHEPDQIGVAHRCERMIFHR